MPEVILGGFVLFVFVVIFYNAAKMARIANRKGNLGDSSTISPGINTEHGAIVKEDGLFKPQSKPSTHSLNNSL